MIPTIATLALLAEEPRLEKLTPVPFTQVTIEDMFWEPRRAVNRTVSLAHSLDMLERSGNIRNLERAIKGERTGYEGPVYMDSDLYKVIEAVSYSLATNPDPILDKRVDGIIAKIALAQRADGYINTWYQVNAPDKRWTNLRDNHELYNNGHLFEAAVAHYQATKKKTFLSIAIKCADHLVARFGDGKQRGYPGHPEVELALMKLWKATGNQKYFELARFFIENRGQKFFADEHRIPKERFDGEYWQDNVPIREHRRIVGHAVRAAYLFSGVTDVVRETEEAALLAMLDRVWRNTTQKNQYLTGGIGPSGSNEGFTEDYDLPNATAYQETCASVAIGMWAHRLNLLYGDAQYADNLEVALYNGILDGVSLDGKRFFYVNPLASEGHHHRSPWFGTACCPPNVARTLSALGGYAYATSKDSLYVNLYIQGTVSTTVGGKPVALKVTTNYPWEGKVTFTITKAAPMQLRLRVPGWTESVNVQINNAKLDIEAPKKGYLALSHPWKVGDTVTVDFPMPVRRIAADPNVSENRGKLAMMRGPLVYCLEEVDNTVPLDTLAIPADATFTLGKNDTLFPGLVTLNGTGLHAANDWEGGLYRTVPPPKSVPFRAIPYAFWDNRTPGQMVVWTPTAPPPPIAGGLERRAKPTMSFVNYNANPRGLNDGKVAAKSNITPPVNAHFWNHLGGTEWAQYEWIQPVELAGTQVFWFDDTGYGACKLPKAWRLLYKDGATWKPVELTQGSYEKTLALDTWNTVRFASVKTTALRLEVTQQDGFASGIHEWRVLTPED